MRDVQQLEKQLMTLGEKIDELILDQPNGLIARVEAMHATSIAHSMENRQEDLKFKHDLDNLRQHLEINNQSISTLRVTAEDISKSLLAVQAQVNVILSDQAHQKRMLHLAWGAVVFLTGFIPKVYGFFHEWFSK